MKKELHHKKTREVKKFEKVFREKLKS